jgi:short-subunit dehydrogenase
MRIHLKPVAEQVIVITGASSGIGLVTARAAARQGASVMLVARNEAALRTIVQDITASGGHAAYAVADVGDMAQVEAAADQAVIAFGRIDTWVSCAGVAIYAKLAETPEAEHQQMFQTNYFGAVHGALTAIRHLHKNGGALITVGSIAGDIPTPVMGAYAASKHAVKGFIESLRIEVNADRLPVQITLIKPSGIDTPIAVHAANHLDGEALIPPPVYDPALVADAILAAAAHPHRSITVGGIGRLQVVAGTHFPGMLARFGGLMMPLLSDPSRPATRLSNLESPFAGGHERSSLKNGRPVSLYALIGQHALATTAGAAALGVTLLLNRRTNKRAFVASRLSRLLNPNRL